jgi:hypothetical protein
LSVLLLAGTAWLVGPRSAQATQDHPLADWLQGQAKPLETTDPTPRWMTSSRWIGWSATP